MGGMFGVVSNTNCALDLFFGIDYHSHLGTKRAGMAVYTEDGDYNRSIHNIENSPFRTKFENDLDELQGYSGIGCISDNDPQPLLVQSHIGSYAITTLGKINNMDELVEDCFKYGHTHFLERSGGRVNATELVAALINQKANLVDGLLFAQEKIKGSMSILILSGDKIYASRDKLGRTPLIVGTKDGAKCVSFEDFAYYNLGFTTEHELGPNEVVVITKDSLEIVAEPKKKMKICSFLWVYYGYPPANYEGVNVEAMRYICGKMLAKRDKEETGIKPDIVAGVPDSGIAHAVGYANESGVPYARPFIKYTPTWPRSFMPQNQAQRARIAKMKLIAVNQLIKDKSLLLIDDSIVRGTQLGETTDFLYQSGAKEVHIRPACPPLLFGCKYLDFSRSKSELDLITRRIIKEREGDNVSKEVLMDYANPDSKNYQEMVEEIRKQLGFTSLRFHRLDDLIESIGLDSDCLCTYCWSGKDDND
ncbi:MAG: amidophosphoribosyltransferase [Ruminococcaceae bacterium]|nr:amidophosphoribosyltransferase [Oscillospiraceae bacterium]